MPADALKRAVLRIPGTVTLYHNLRAVTVVLYEGWLADRRRMNDQSLATRAWDFEKPTTRERYDRVLAALSAAAAAPWGEVLEIACADGVFTRDLAERCRRVVAVDISTVACERTRARCADRTNVTVAPLDLQKDPLPGQFDVVFAMDVLEFIHGRSRIAATARKLADGVRPGGYLVISMSRLPDDMRDRAWARWLIEGGDNMAAFLDGRNGLRLLQRECYPRYLIAIYQKIA
jgi:2-polyprenyl-3-methyl-5-hydroxy-6-metoxy-1,4-benzoquinol methylase